MFDELLDNLVVLPVQLQGRPQRSSHQDLQLSILVQSIQDLASSESAEDLDSAIEWLNDLKSEDPFSFRTCCESNYIEPQKLRNALCGLSVAMQLEEVLRLGSAVDVSTGRPTIEELRGDGSVQICPHGHKNSPENLYITQKGARYVLRCLECARRGRRNRNEENQYTLFPKAMRE